MFVRRLRASRPSRARHAVPARMPAARWRWVAAIAATIGALTGSLVVLPSASAASYAFTVNSLDFAGGDTNLGDGVCQTSAGTCTLKAAIQESNKLNQAAGSVTITAAPGLTGNIKATTSTSDWMTYGYIDSPVVDTGAYYTITAPVTVDLGNQVTINSDNDTEVAVFYVNSSGVTFKNMTDVLAGGSSFVMGASANGVTITGGSTKTSTNYYPERFLVYDSGAQNITLSDYTLQGFYNAGYGGNTGLFVFASSDLSKPNKNIVIDHVTVSFPTSGNCTGSDGSGCKPNLVTLPNRGYTSIDGFQFTNSTVTNLGSYSSSFPFGTGSSAGVPMSNLNISYNNFLGSIGYFTSESYAFITLGTWLGGTNQIVGNNFVSAGSGQNYAIYWGGATGTGVTPSNLAITDNYFDGYTGEGIRLYQSGTTTVARNTFGTKNVSQSGTSGQAEETGSGDGWMFLNYDTTANNKVNTWYPSTSASVVHGTAPSGSIAATNPRAAANAQACTASVALTAPTTSIPSGPVTLDLYWTSKQTAELYLGHVTGVTGSAATVTFGLPVGAQTLASTSAVTGAGANTATAVNASTGAVNGYVRVQTLSEKPGGTATAPPYQSSQYSRYVAVTGTCAPTLTINQASGQVDSTMGRDLHFTVTSDIALDPSGVTASAITLQAAATSDTIDASRINPRIVSVTPIAGTNNQQFDVVVRVDDSAKVTVAIAAGAIASPSGVKNVAAATSTDNAITFVNPLLVSPAKFTLVMGAPDGKPYTISVKGGAPTPTAALDFTATLDEVGVSDGLTLSTTTPVIAAGGSTTDRIVVKAPDGTVTANTKVTITHKVTSDDSNYDGLVVASMNPYLFSTDPTIQITKRAFADATDTSTPAKIESTGTPVLTGGRLLDGQAVCFVYTVTNTSADDWATSLTNVSVTDSDTRLGTNGLIGTIASLGVGDAKKLSACATLIPVDTTTGTATASAGE